MRIAEIFYSIQGEGKLVGVPTVFVRTSGCNLRCTWCDTPYASWNPEGPDLTPSQIVERVTQYPARHVVLTGGEPMMVRELPSLIALLKAHHKHITIETAGTLWLEDVPAGGVDLASISPKLGNSTPWQRESGRFAQAHEAHRLNLEVLRQFATGGAGTFGRAVVECQWKFVVAARQDLVEIEALIAQLNASLPANASIQSEDIVLMPEGTDAQTLTVRSRDLAEWCKEKSYRLSPRLHVYLYGNQRGT